MRKTDDFNAMHVFWVEVGHGNHVNTSSQNFRLTLLSQCFYSFSWLFTIYPTKIETHKLEVWTLFCLNPAVQCHLASTVAYNLRLSISTCACHGAQQSGRQNAWSVHRNSFWFHEAVWCDGLDRHLLRTVHTSAFHWWQPEWATFPRGNLETNCRDLCWAAFCFEGLSLDRRVFLASLATISSRHVTLTPSGCYG